MKSPAPFEINLNLASVGLSHRDRHLHVHDLA